MCLSHGFQLLSRSNSQATWPMVSPPISSIKVRKANPNLGTKREKEYPMANPRIRERIPATTKAKGVTKIVAPVDILAEPYQDDWGPKCLGSSERNSK